MNNLGDYLGKKAQQLDLGRGDELVIIQKQLDDWYPGKVKAQKIHNGKLTLITTSSSVANELRFKSEQLIKHDNGITKVVIR